MKTLATIFKKPTYASLGFFVSLISFVVFSITPHISELRQASRLDTSLGAEGTVFRETLLSMLKHTFEPTFIPTFLLAILFGIIVVLLTHYYKKQGSLLIKTSGAGTIGLLLGVLGIGCSACGTLALTAVLGTVGLGSLVLFLPFRGAEFLYVGVVLMLFSVWQIIKLINKPLICE